jgi:hypothetical protein
MLSIAHACRPCPNKYQRLIQAITCGGCSKIALGAAKACTSSDDCKMASRSAASEARNVKSEAGGGDSDEGGSGGSTTGLILGIIAALLIAGCCLGVGAFLAWRKWGGGGKGGDVVPPMRSMAPPPPRLDDVIATNHFGSFGSSQHEGSMMHAPNGSMFAPPTGGSGAGFYPPAAGASSAAAAPSAPPAAPANVYSFGSSGARHISPEPYVSTGSGIANGAEWLPPGSIPQIKVPPNQAYPPSLGNGRQAGFNAGMAPQNFSGLPQEHQSTAVHLAAAPANNIRVTYLQVLQSLAALMLQTSLSA